MSSGGVKEENRGPQYAVFEMILERAGRTFPLYIMKAWMKDKDGKYKPEETRELMKILKTETRSSSAGYETVATLEAPVGAVLKVLDEGTVKYFMVNERGLEEMKAEVNEVVVFRLKYEGREYKIWFYRGRVMDGDGNVIIMDEEEDPPLHANMPGQLIIGETHCRLSELKEFKKRVLMRIFSKEGDKALRRAVKEGVIKVRDGYLVPIKAEWRFEGPSFFLVDGSLEVYSIPGPRSLGYYILRGKVPPHLKKDIDDETLTKVAREIGKIRPDISLVLLPH